MWIKCLAQEFETLSSDPQSPHDMVTLPHSRQENPSKLWERLAGHMHWPDKSPCLRQGGRRGRTPKAVLGPPHVSWSPTQKKEREARKKEGRIS